MEQQGLIAEVRDTESARRVIVDLEHAGIDPDALVFHTDGPPIDGPAPLSMARRAAAGAAAGGVAAVAGALVLLLTPVAGLDRLVELVVAAAVFGTAVGAVLGATTAMGNSAAWRATFRGPARTTPCVEVRSSDEESIRIATETLRQDDAVRRIRRIAA